MHVNTEKIKPDYFLSCVATIGGLESHLVYHLNRLCWAPELIRTPLVRLPPTESHTWLEMVVTASTQNSIPYWSQQ